VILKSAPFAIAVALMLAWGGVACADDYKPSEYLGLDLSKVSETWNTPNHLIFPVAFLAGEYPFDYFSFFVFARVCQQNIAAACRTCQQV